jgi:sulfite reductase (NADPH) flavoprotein alpha-component
MVMGVPILPESAPFTQGQRAWLNGFFAGVFGLANGSAPAAVVAAAPASRSPAPPVAFEENFPWHDPALPLDERLKLAEGTPHERMLMAAMAQLDCGSCGYVCQTYAEAIARGEEKDLTKCSPGGIETARKLKELSAGRKPLPAVVLNGNGHAGRNGHAPNVAKQPRTDSDGELPAPQFDRSNPFPAPLLQCVPLNAPGSEKDVRHVVFSLKGSGLSFEPGDALGVFPRNDPELVEGILRLMGARGDEIVSTPDGSRAHAYDALLRHYVITKISPAFAKLLAANAADPSEGGTLRTLVENDVEGVPTAWDVLDILEQFPSARAAIPEMIAALAPLNPRLYSISSSLKTHPDEVHLTVSVVRYTQGGRRRKGVASNYLTDTLRVRGKAGVFVHRSPGFRLPTDGGTPIIMIGPGTGIAPFRAFLQERAVGGATGPNWLFFGDRRRHFDFLYREEIEGFLARGTLTRLDLAFSRDQEEKVYVQHKMRENADELWRWIEEGAHVYVCGDARRMALDVDHALHALIAAQGRMSDDEATLYVKRLVQSRRYQRDVY